MKTLTESEQRYVDELIREGENTTAFIANAWIPWVILLAGGIFLVCSMMIAESSQSDRTIKFILLPGVGGGFLLMVVAALLIRYTERTRERLRLAEILRKLTR
jgi:hypothetical protein